MHPLSTGASAAQRTQAGAPCDDQHPALWHAQAGWLRPAALVRAMLAAPGVRFVGPAPVARLARCGAAWQVQDAAGAVLAEAELVVLAAGFDTLALLQASSAAGTDSAAWPLHALRGQVAFGPWPESEGAGLPCPVNGHGSLIAPLPTEDGPLWITGASFERAQALPTLRAADHASNRQRLTELLPGVAERLTPQWDDGRAQAWAGVRCTVPDRLPMLGPLTWPAATGAADGSASNQPPALLDRAQSAINSVAFQTPEAACPAPWVFTGLGARGLTLAVLCGEIAAAWLHDEPLPVERSLARTLRAARWGAATPRQPRPASGHPATAVQMPPPLP